MYVNNRSWNSGARLETERKSCVARSGERMAAHHDPKSAGELPASSADLSLPHGTPIRAASSDTMYL